LLSELAVKRLAHDGKITQTTRLLLCVAVEGSAKSTQEIKAIAKRVGIPAQRLNVSALLGASRGAIRTGEGWELSPHGVRVVEALAGPSLASAAPAAATSLRSHLKGIRDVETRAFVDQAISCLEYKLYRAAVLLSWVGAVSLLYDHVLTNELARFNTEAGKRDTKWKAARTRDDLALMKEHDFLQILQSLSIVGKNVKTELGACLKLRNACGHPSSLQIADNRVSAHIEILALNVFGRF